MNLRPISIATVILMGIALPAASQTPGSSPGPQMAMELPAACRIAASDGKSMLGTASPKEMPGSSLSTMTDAQKAYMQAMTNMHPPMTAGVMIKDPDTAFACAMMPHHQGAIDMARVVLKHGKDASIRAMAETMIREQEKEIGELKAWLAKKSASNAAVPQKVAETSAATAVPTTGEVVKIDLSAGKITLKHGPIKNLDMDSMTMAFRVADPAMLDKVKAGDKVNFEADRINGAITITKIGKNP